MPNVCPFFTFTIAFCEKGKDALAFWSFLFSLSRSLSIFFLPLVFRVSYKTLKLGAVKLSSLLLLFCIHHLIKPPKNKRRFTFLSSNFLNSKWAQKQKKKTKKKSSSFLIIIIFFIYINLLCRTERRDTHFREEEDECGRAVLRAYTLSLRF